MRSDDRGQRPMNLARGSPARATALVLVAACLFGTTGTALARVEPDAPPNGVSALRLLIGAVTLVVVAASGGARWRSLRGHGALLAVGGLAVATYQLCFFVGTTRTGVAVATVVTIGSGPVFGGVDRRGRVPPPTDRRLARRHGPRHHGCGAPRREPARRARWTDWGCSPPSAPASAGPSTRSIGKVCIGRGLDSSACMAALFTGGALLLAPFLVLDDIGWAASAHGARAGPVPRRRHGRRGLHLLRPWAARAAGADGDHAHARRADHRRGARQRGAPRGHRPAGLGGHRPRARGPGRDRQGRRDHGGEMATSSSCSAWSDGVSRNRSSRTRVAALPRRSSTGPRSPSSSTARPSST